MESITIEILNSRGSKRKYLLKLSSLYCSSLLGLLEWCFVLKKKNNQASVLNILINIAQEPPDVDCGQSFQYFLKLFFNVSLSCRQMTHGFKELFS